MKEQLEVWKGEFGNAYTDRNPVDWKTLLPIFAPIIDGLEIRSVLEVGCNRGHNLVALRELLGPGARVVGVEPNPHALALAKAAGNEVVPGSIFNLPFPDGEFDLVFTAGVLIHIAQAGLAAALKEVYRCSRRYLLAAEYFAEQETVLPYQGQANLLWKRNFPRHYQNLLPDLVPVRNGYEAGWDRTHWWVFEKSSRAPSPSREHHRNHPSSVG
jgi:pseudaminic acid biosynthesis-associated methylase